MAPQDVRVPASVRAGVAEWACGLQSVPATGIEEAWWPGVCALGSEIEEGPGEVFGWQLAFEELGR